MKTQRSGASRLRRYLLALVLLLAVLCGAWSFRVPTLRSLGQFLNYSDSPRRVDYCLVLGGDVQVRPFVAAALVHARLADAVLLTRSPEPSSGMEDEVSLREHDKATRILIARGVPADAIHLLPGAVDSTRDEARELAEFLNEHPGSSVAVVTSNMHTRRARLVFGRVLGARVADVCFVAAPVDGMDELEWWRTEPGFTLYLTEYARLAANLIGL